MRANCIKSGEDYDNKWRRIKQQITWWKKTSGRAVATSQNIINTIIKRVTISGIKRHAGKKKNRLTCSDAENLGTSQINKHDTKYKTTSDKQPLKKRDDK